MTDFQKPKNYDRIAELYALFGKSSEFRKTFYDNDWAVPYQKNGETIYFHPVTVDCYVPFHTLAQSILIDKTKAVTLRLSRGRTLTISFILPNTTILNIC